MFIGSRFIVSLSLQNEACVNIFDIFSLYTYTVYISIYVISFYINLLLNKVIHFPFMEKRSYLKGKVIMIYDYSIYLTGNYMNSVIKKKHQTLDA